jgi:hypothetical protein
MTTNVIRDGSCPDCGGYSTDAKECSDWSWDHNRPGHESDGVSDAKGGNWSRWFSDNYGKPIVPYEA